MRFEIVSKSTGSVSSDQDSLDLNISEYPVVRGEILFIL